MKRLSPTTNADIARVMADIADYLIMEGTENSFRIRAYERAAETIAELGAELRDAYARGGTKALEEIPGIGEAIALKIEELLRTGRLRYYERLQKAIPVRLDELRGIEGLGPKTIAKLYRKLGVRTLKDLERAAGTGKIARLDGFGAKSQERILASIGFKKSGSGRRPLFAVLPDIERLRAILAGQPGVRVATVAGSLRRRKETVGDADILVVAARPVPVMDFFTRMPEVGRVLARGGTKASVQLRSGFQVDLRVVPAESYGAALNYFTGSKEHNVALRELAIKKGWKLNEYGLWRVGRGKEHMIAGKTEEEVYRRLGLRYIEPELREDTGEIEAARGGKLPQLVGYDDLRGDLQTQTDWTDGRGSIEAMALAAAERGLAYVAITDHTKSVTVAQGLEPHKVRKQWAEIDRVNARLRTKGVKLTVLKGTECDIRKDGALDLPDDILAKLDVAGVSVHYHTKLSRKDQTTRIIRAMENPHVDILFHPTGRIVGRRPPYDVDMDAIVKAAKRTGTVLEVNASERLDLRDEHIRAAVEAGAKLAIDSDAHAPEHFDLLPFGIAQARRGWAEGKDVVNAQPLPQMRRMLKG